jgi:hypothetical protein
LPPVSARPLVLICDHDNLLAPAACQRRSRVPLHFRNS